MYTAVTGEGAASIDFPDDGLILAAHLTLSMAANADGEGAQCELSFGSTSATGTNDARQVLCGVYGKTGLLTSGAATDVARQSFDFHEGIRVFGGERLYMHTGVTGTGTFTYANAWLLMRFKNFIPRRR